MNRSENLYGNLPIAESKLLEDALSEQAFVHKIHLFHPDDATKGFDSNNPLANLCDLGTAFLGEIYGKQSLGGRKQRFWVYETEDKFHQGSRKNKIDRHYDYFHSVFNEVDLTRVQFPEGYYFYLVPDSQKFRFPSSAIMGERLKIFRPGALAYISREIQGLSEPTDQLLAWIEKQNSNNTLD